MSKDVENFIKLFKEFIRKELDLNVKKYDFEEFNNKLNIVTREKSYLETYKKDLQKAGDLYRELRENIQKNETNSKKVMDRFKRFFDIWKKRESLFSSIHREKPKDTVNCPICNGKKWVVEDRGVGKEKLICNTCKGRGWVRKCDLSRDLSY